MASDPQTPQANADSQPKARSITRIVIRILGTFAVTVVAFGVVHESCYRDNKATARKALAGIECTAISEATKAFTSEYGHLPLRTASFAAGGSELNAALIAVFFAKNDTENPKKIIYLETRRVKDSKKPRGGFDPNTGLFFDPWGNYYRIALDTDGDGKIENPYDDAGEKMLKADVIVWSPGKDGIQGVKSNPRQFRGSDDVVSWQ